MALGDSDPDWILGRGEILCFVTHVSFDILSFETINKLMLFFERGIPRPQDVGRLCLHFFFLPYLIISIAVLDNVPPDAGLQKRATRGEMLLVK
jgi:hypothetical protein